MSIKNYRHFSGTVPTIERSQIIACFGRYFDKVSIETNKIHLISKIAMLPLESFFRFDNLSNFLIDYNNSNSNYKHLKFDPLTEKNCIVIQIVKDSRFDSNISDIKYNYTKYSSYLVVYTIPLSYFLSVWSSNFEYSFVFEKLFSNSYNKEKDFYGYLNDTVFIFEDFNWVSIKEIFKSCNINISKGNSSRRNVLSTVDHNLSSFLFNVGVFFDNHIIYSSFDNLTNKNKNKNKNKLKDCKVYTSYSEYVTQISGNSTSFNEVSFLLLLSTMRNKFMIALKFYFKHVYLIHLVLGSKEGKLNKSELESEISEYLEEYKSELENKTKFLYKGNFFKDKAEQSYAMSYYQRDTLSALEQQFKELKFIIATLFEYVKEFFLIKTELKKKYEVGDYFIRNSFITKLSDLEQQMYNSIEDTYKKISIRAEFSSLNPFDEVETIRYRKKAAPTERVKAYT